MQSLQYLAQAYSLQQWAIISVLNITGLPGKFSNQGRMVRELVIDTAKRDVA